jgi:hypothetical protein
MENYFFSYLLKRHLQKCCGSAAFLIVSQQVLPPLASYLFTSFPDFLSLYVAVLAWI